MLQLGTANPAQAQPIAPRVAAIRIGLCTSPGTAAENALAAGLNARISAALQGPGQRSIGFSLLDWATGISCTFRQHWHTQSASAVKAIVVATLLWQHQRSGKPVSRHERSLCARAIRFSDNDAAAELFTHIGGDRKLRVFLRAAHMRETFTQTRANVGGDTRITTADQIRLMQVINNQSSILTPASQQFEIRLLHTVARGQRWGVPAGAGGTTFVEVKNGWGPRDTRGWRITSVGYLANQRHRYAMSLISDTNPDMESGVRRINRVARAVNGLLR